MLLIKPKTELNAEESKKIIFNSVNPSNLKVGIESYRETKKGGMIMKCKTKDELETLKKAAMDKLGHDFLVEIPKKKLPRLRIVGYKGKQNIDELEIDIRKQNRWIQANDEFKVTYIKKYTRKRSSTIFLECVPEMYFKAMNMSRICIGWERYQVYEDLNVLRCFKCQGFNHKSDNCRQNETCANCADQHSTDTCTNSVKKCINCSIANDKFNTLYNVNHASTDVNCPSTQYHTDLLKSRIDYGS